MWGREGPREGPCLATGFLQGSCPVSLVLEAISPEKEYNDCPWGIFLASDSRAGLLRPSMSHQSPNLHLQTRHPVNSKEAAMVIQLLHRELYQAFPTQFAKPGHFFI